jgi:hypothetical protein
MASYNYTFASGDTVTPTKLNNARTVSEIVNADVKSDAAIAGTKIAPNFGSQNIATTGSLGVGTTATTFKTISAHGTDDGAWLHGSSTSSYIGLGGFASGAAGAFRLNYERTSGAITFSGGSRDTPAERMRIDGVGNVLIGTTTAAAPLTLSGAATHFSLVNTSAATDNKNWNWVTTATNLRLRAISDAGAAGGHTFEFVRSSNLVNEFAGYNSGAAWFTINNDLQRVGVGTASPNAAAMLDVSSTTKGFLPPRMTTAQRDAISSPPAGLVIYNTSTNVLNFYNGSAWGAV